jgi:hypothetical protein
MAGNAGKDLSTSSRIQPEALLDLPNPLTPQLIQIEQHHSCAANGSQSFNFMAFESEVFRPPQLEGMKQGHLLARQRIGSCGLVGLMQVASGARQSKIFQRGLAARRSRDDMFGVKSGALQTFMHEAVLALPMCAQPDGPRQRLWHGHLGPLA